jgi:hypothetical protein
VVDAEISLAVHGSTSARAKGLQAKPDRPAVGSNAVGISVGSVQVVAMRQPGRDGHLWQEGSGTAASGRGFGKTSHGAFHNCGLAL